MSDKRWRSENPSAHYATLASPTEPHPWRDTALVGHWRRRDIGRTLEGHWTARVVCLIWSDHTQVAPPFFVPPTQPNQPNPTMHLFSCTRVLA